MDFALTWDRLTREQKVAALARGDGPTRACPACGRQVQIVRGYWTQHSDPRSRGQRHIEQCPNELTPTTQSVAPTV